MAIFLSRKPEGYKNFIWMHQIQKGIQRNMDWLLLLLVVVERHLIAAPTKNSAFFCSPFVRFVFQGLRHVRFQLVVHATWLKHIVFFTWIVVVNVQKMTIQTFPVSPGAGCRVTEAGVVCGESCKHKQSQRPVAINMKRLHLQNYFYYYFVPFLLSSTVEAFHQKIRAHFGASFDSTEEIRHVTFSTLSFLLNQITLRFASNDGGKIMRNFLQHRNRALRGYLSWNLVVS